MADTTPVALFYRDQRPLGYRVVSFTTLLRFDLLLQEGHSFTNTVTKYSVENGSPITDHIQNNNEAANISGFITNFSINEGSQFSNRSQDAFEKLEKLWKERRLVTVVTIHKIYENMAINSITVARSEASGEDLVADIVFEKVNVVTLQSIEVRAAIGLLDPVASDVNKQSMEEKDKGKNNGDPDDEMLVEISLDEFDLDVGETISPASNGGYIVDY